VNDRILPHDLDAELGLLNACFCPGGIERVIEVVEPSDFYSEGGKEIFAKMVEFYKAGTYSSLYQIDRAFQGHANYVSIRRILDKLIPITAECAAHFAGRVKRLSDRRKAIKQAYLNYLELHNLATPLPSGNQQPAMARGVYA